MTDEFCVESVRRFMIDHGGRVSNHQLVTHFKKQLNDPNKKAINRDKFKDFVNTLASVKVDEGGEKLLVLKKKYRNKDATNSAGTLKNGAGAEDSTDVKTNRESPETSSASSGSSYSINRDGSLTPDTDRESNVSERVSVSSERGMETPDRAPSVSREEEEKNEKLSLSAMSVRERAKHLNKLQSESDLEKSFLKARDGKSEKGEGGDEEDSQSGSSVSMALGQTEREWLITASSADYHPLAKLLLKDSNLAHCKDFTSGFTALHWAAKHGKLEVVKLICGTQGVLVNARSHGGYTPLHLAAMHGHEDIIEVLVQAYGADTNIRDYSGKKAKQYLRNSASTRSQQLLQARRLSTNIAASSHQPFRRVGSYSAKIQKSGYFGILSGATVRSSWAAADSGSEKSPSPTPPSSPGHRRKGSLGSRKSSTSRDAEIMPPPKGAPLRRRWTKKNKENEPRDTSPAPDTMKMSSSEPDLSHGGTQV